MGSIWRMLSSAAMGTRGTIAPPSLAERYDAVRRQTERLCEPLVTEDYVVQSMPDVSPTKWHLAHTSWFFETFLLSPHVPGYRPFDPHFAYLFNSYYVAVGDRHCRQNRGLLSRPTVERVWEYRRYIDEQMRRWLGELERNGPLPRSHDLMSVIELGLHHEQQHQELMLTDIKHVFWVNPMRPAYRQCRAGTALADEAPSFPSPGTPGKGKGGGPSASSAPRPGPPFPPSFGVPEEGVRRAIPASKWVAFSEGVRAIGFAGDGFAFDNETPRHRVFLERFELASRLVTSAEYKQFIDVGGYSQPNLWLSAGWATLNQQQWSAPLYWIKQDGRWWHHTLS